MFQEYHSDTLNDWDEPQDVLAAVIPEDRIGAPVPNRTRRRLARLAAVGLAGAAGYALTTYQPDWYHQAFERAHMLKDAALEAFAKSRAGMAPQPPPAIAEPLPLPAAAPPPAPTLAAAASEAALPTKAVEEAPPVAATAYTPEAQPAAAPPEQAVARARAAKAGLGPDLPNVLLARLSKADLENAAYAIKTALVKTPEDAVLSWPPKPSPKQALFEVRFVPGAMEGCRRYVVTVTKEHWSTTSGAVEKCKNDETR